MRNASATVKLGEVLRRVDRFEPRDEITEYPFAGTYSFARGIFVGERKLGSTFALPKIQRIRAGDFIYCKIMAWEGAFGIAPKEADNCVMSGAFVVYELDRKRIDEQYLDYFFKVPDHWRRIGNQSTGTNVRRQSLHPGQFERAEIRLPPLSEQRRIVARIEELADQISEALMLREEIDRDLNAMLAAAHRQIAEDAPRKPLSEAAPLTRRPVIVEREKNYPAIAVRSFGRGTFHKPPLVGSEVTWEKPFLVRAGDILISNIKAWEGALAVAKPEDDGRVGSHRYLTCVPIQGVATARFVCFHLLTPEGLYEVGEASPGSADRNRTLSAKAFMQIPIPVPEYAKQVWFDSLCAEADALKRLQAETAAELDALLPAILDRAFKGEL